MSEILHLLIGYFGLGALVTAGCGAAAVFITLWVPPPFGDGLRRILIEAAIVAGICSTIYGKGYIDGAAEKQAQWDKALSAQIKKGDAAHDGAVNDVARGLSDHYDRDQQPGGVRPVARSLLLHKK